MRLPKWLAIYNDGTQLAESDASNFYDIDRSRLERFALVCSSSFTMELDADNGTFKINDKVLQHPELDRITHYSYVQYGAGLVQFKKAHVDINNMVIGDEILDSANMGYKITLDNHLHQVILSYDFDDESVALNVKVTDLAKQEVIKDDSFLIEGVK